MPNINQILARPPRTSTYGAPMGARDSLPESGELPRLYLQRLRMVDGDYATDGTYWGCASREHGAMWCAFDATGETRLYTRAKTREAAAANILEDYPEAHFARRPVALTKGLQ